MISRTLKHFSPSQVRLFEQCPRRWGFDKIFNVETAPEQESKAAGEGGLIHRQIEGWGKEGAEVTHPLAQLAVDWLQQNTGPLRIFESGTSDPKLLAYGLHLKGFLDLIDISDPDQVEVVDWKSRANFSYAPNDEQLAVDTQLVVYAKYVALKYKPKRVRVRHVNLRTGLVKPRVDNALLVNGATLTIEEIDANYRPIEETVGRMVHAAATAQVPEDLPANSNYCHAYNRPCGYLMQCEAATLLAPGYGQASFTKPPTAGQTTMTSPEDETERIKAKMGPRATGINPPDAAKPPDAATVTTTPAPVQGESTSTGLYLYVDTLPAKGVTSVINLEDLIAPIAKAICDKANVTDVRLVPYGQGGALLCSHFRTHPPGGIVLASSTGLSGLVLETLLPLAAQVWRSVR